MESEPDPNYENEYFVNDNSSQIQFADNFKVKWIISCDFPFRNLSNLPPNPMNDYNPIRQSKNGQELPYKLGNYLCHLLYNFEHPSKIVHCPLSNLNQK